MVAIEILKKELIKMVRIDLENDAIRIEAGAMYYMVGTIELEAKAPSLGGFLKSALTREAPVKPVYRGTGQLFLEPTYGDFMVMELNNEEWILDKGAFYAAEMGVNVDMWTNKAIAGLFGGEGFFQTKVAGTGKVVVSSHGPLEEVVLQNSKLVVDGSFAVARTGGLEYKVEKATKGIFRTLLSGEGLVSTFTGTGRVLIAPARRGYAELMNQFGIVNTNIAAIDKSSS